MAIWTSRYSNKELQNGKYYSVGISLGRPKFNINYRIQEQCYDLAPARWMWGKELEDFKRMYFSKLDAMGVDKVQDILQKLHNDAKANGQDLVLLCFEDVRDPKDWCHRTMLAEWVKKRIGWDIKELPNPQPPKIKRKKTESENENNEYQQLSLFDICNA